MSPDTIEVTRIGLAAVGVGVTVVISAWRVLRSMRKDLEKVGNDLDGKIGALTTDMATANQRLAHIEGWIQGRFNEGAR